MNVIFLDIDGVLNSTNYMIECNGTFDYPENQMDKNAIKRLNKITGITGAKIVVSSTWRLHFINKPLDRLQICMRSYGITGEIVGMTNNEHGGPDRRGKQIQDWINEHPELDKFVIIDDDSDMGHLLPHLIKTSTADGLLDKHVDIIIERLTE